MPETKRILPRNLGILRHRKTFRAVKSHLKRFSVEMNFVRTKDQMTINVNILNIYSKSDVRGSQDFAVFVPIQSQVISI